MSFPTIPDVNPAIDVELADVVNLLLASIAFEELGLAHIINAEAEKIQFVIGTLDDQAPSAPPTIEDLLEIDRSVEQTLKSVIKTEILLQFKLEEILTISTSSTTTTSTTTTTTSTTTTTTSTTTTTTSTTTTTTSTTTTTTSTTTTTTSTTTTTTSTTTTTTSTTTTTTSTTTTTTTTSTTTTSTTSTTTTTTKEDLGSAWSVGTQFGNAPNSGYFTLASDQNQTSVVLGLGAQHTPVGTVSVLRQGNNLEVTITTNSPFVMGAAHLYVDDTPPTNSAPGQLGNTFDPGFFFTTHTFIVDISAFAGETIFIAAHATIFQ